jgi:Fe-S-cluster containining protein
MKKTECKKCNANCCKEIAFFVGSKKKNDYFRWFSYRKNCKVVKRGTDYWFILKIGCLKLKNNKCSIYKNRPKLCKEYDCNNKLFYNSRLPN